jgi:chromosome segregation ATPase
MRGFAQVRRSSRLILLPEKSHSDDSTARKPLLCQSIVKIRFFGSGLPQFRLQSAPRKSTPDKGTNVHQVQHDLQLKVWKELAISKQVLMRTAAEALKLDPDCAAEDLKLALESALKKVAEADANVVKAQEQARAAVAEMEKKLADSLKAQAAAEAASALIRAAQEKAAPQLEVERATAAKEIQKLKDGLSEKEKTLKAINTALNDTPESIVKKMKALKKERQDEADSRREIEASLNIVRKEKREQDQLFTGLKESSAKLITVYRGLHAVGVTLHEQLQPLLAKGAELAALPELDTETIESIENPGAKDKDKDKDKDDKGKKGKGAK